VVRRKTNSARAQLHDFLKQLASHRDESGVRPMTDAAFWLLKVNAEYVLGQSGP
jgi:hypothetical protein